MSDINSAGLDRTNTATATRLVWTAEDVAVVEPDLMQVLPAHPALHGLLPWAGGIRRGATVAAVGGTSLLIALLAAAMAEGSWAACSDGLKLTVDHPVLPLIGWFADSGAV